MQDITQNSRRGRIHWCPQPLLFFASRVQLFSPSDQPWDCSSVLDFPCLLLKNWYQLLAQPSQWRVFIYIIIYFFIFFTYNVMGVARERQQNECFAATGGLFFCFSLVAIVPLVRTCTHRLFSCLSMVSSTVLFMLDLSSLNVWH